MPSGGHEKPRRFLDLLSWQRKRERYELICIFILASDKSNVRRYKMPNQQCDAGKEIKQAHKLKMSIAKCERLMRPRIPMSVELKAKLAAVNVGHKPSQETLERMRLANIGRKHTAETKQKISVINKGRKRSPETRARMSLAAKRRIVLPETGLKISQAKIGVKHSEEHKKAIGVEVKVPSGFSVTTSPLSRRNRISSDLVRGLDGFSAGAACITISMGRWISLENQ